MVSATYVMFFYLISDRAESKCMSISGTKEGMLAVVIEYLSKLKTAEAIYGQSYIWSDIFNMCYVVISTGI